MSIRREGVGLIMPPARAAGAVLFRGFKVEEGVDFQEVVRKYNPDLSDQYRGTSPRRLVPGTQVRCTSSWWDWVWEQVYESFYCGGMFQ